jgi:thiamine monophosphate synthase
MTAMAISRVAESGRRHDQGSESLQTGAHGVAMIRAVLAALDLCLATWQLRQQLPSTQG